MFLSKKIKLSLVFGGSILTLSCSAGEYQFQSGKSVCLTEDVVEVKESETHSGRVRRLLVRLEELPMAVALSHAGDESVAKSLLLTVEEKARAPESDYYKDVFNRAVESERLAFDEALGLYRLPRETESALKSYDYLKVKPKPGDLMQSSDLPDWYLGMCVEGLGRPDTCEITYATNGLLLKFSVVHDALVDWRSLLQTVNSRVKSWECDRPI